MLLWQSLLWQGLLTLPRCLTEGLPGLLETCGQQSGRVSRPCHNRKDGKMSRLRLPGQAYNAVSAV